MHHLKVTVCKYLHSRNRHAMIHKDQYDMNKITLWKALLHIILFQYFNSFKKIHVLCSLVPRFFLYQTDKEHFLIHTLLQKIKKLPPKWYTMYKFY